MLLNFAPMEGIGSRLYRQNHARFFGGVAEYFAPFIAPDGSGRFKAGALRDILPENNEGLRLIPQLLVNRAEPFLQVARQLQELGYDEVNLNIGCPSGTVVAKHKGAGMLLDLRSLDDCLADIFSRCPIAVSIKTRMGVERTEEFAEILEIYNKYPIKRLIIHARARAGMYKSRVDLPAFLAALPQCRCPVWYNGDIFSPADLKKLEAAEGLAGVMLGRGAVADPALPRLIQGGEALRAGELKCFHDALLEGFLAEGLPEQATMARLKELWFYMLFKFPGSKKEAKTLLKSQRLSDYRAAVEGLFASGKFDAGSYFWQ
ncbi:MAG: tRNA dihydrouridine synthase [Candidatus Limivicinus sp.]